MRDYTLRDALRESGDLYKPADAEKLRDAAIECIEICDETYGRGFAEKLVAMRAVLIRALMGRM